MKIKLGNGFMLSVLPLNFMLEREKVHDEIDKNNFGEKYTVFIGYSGKIEALLDQLVDNGGSEKDCNTLREIVDARKKLMRELNKRCLVGLEDALRENLELEKLNTILSKENRKLKKKAGVKDVETID